MARERITITVESELVAAVNGGVEHGRARSVSAWINAAIAERLEREDRLAALAAVLAEYEAEHGEFTDEELDAQVQSDREAAAAVRARRQPHRRSA